MSESDPWKTRADLTKIDTALAQLALEVSMDNWARAINVVMRELPAVLKELRWRREMAE